MRPEQKFKAGGIEATVWRNKSAKDGAESEFYSVGFAKSYKDKSGSWKTTSSLGVQDIPKAIAVLGKAFEWCVMKRKDDDGSAVA